MNPIYTDLHIHTSNDPDKLETNYDIKCLISKIKYLSHDSEYLISLTDHNTINKNAYLKATPLVNNILLGVELHIRNYPNESPYHCHIYFDIEDITSKVIDEINLILDDLYPSKVVCKEDDIPSLERIVKKFDSYEFVLLPHGGQSHSTFHKSIPSGVKLDNRIERGVYYNQFDGFTARGNTKLGTTTDYFTKLGINDFVNLITCSDNYSPYSYPNPKAKNAELFIPTWMLASPTFNGLRLSLSESSRLVYSHEKPILWSECITKVRLNTDDIKINVDLTPGLNVIIGGSSSGKTLFVDSLYNKINNDFTNCVYNKFGVKDINVVNTSKMLPHYLSQNYIMKVIDNTNLDNSIEDITIIKRVFPGDKDNVAYVKQELVSFKENLSKLISSLKTIEEEQENFKTTPVLSALITDKDIENNILGRFLPTDKEIALIDYTDVNKSKHMASLLEIESFLNKHPLLKHNNDLIPSLREELIIAREISLYEKKVRDSIVTKKELLDSELISVNSEQQTKRLKFEELLKNIKSYSEALDTFDKTLKTISEYSITCDSQEENSMGHKLYIENKFTLNKEKFIEVINHYLKAGQKIDDFESLVPEKLFKSNYKKQNPKVHGYDDFEAKICSDFEGLNKKTYKIITNKGKKFEDLSAGWKTSVILDILLGYEKDNAPLIIDQPEDNLATNYINEGLITAIKKIKSKKQIILVSHNATIPMLGDAQNIILCKNKGSEIIIKSGRLEGEIDGYSVVDHIAKITDGGKRSIKKRVKKYNLKNFRE